MSAEEPTNLDLIKADIADWKSRFSYKKNRKPVRDVNKEHSENLSPLDKMALFITNHVGTMGFFLIIVTWTVLWLGWNSLAPKKLQFDPPTAFVFWLFISNMIQIFLMPLIMVGQNLQSRHSELRAQNDFEINIKAEKEVDAVLHKIEYQNVLIEAMLVKIGVNLDEVLKSAKYEPMDK